MVGVDNMDSVRIGNFIKELRKKNHLTQKEFADKLGVTYQAVSKWENGKNIPDILLLKEISTIFQVNIDDLLNGGLTEKKVEKKHKNWRLIGIVSFFLLCFIFCFLFCFHENDFVFKTISSSCDEFTLTGSAAYNREKTSIYISEVNYCGKEDDTRYQSLKCFLYENYKNTTTEIASCGSSTNTMTLEDFLDNLQINVNDYEASCKMFASSSLYLEIQAQEIDGKQRVYKIPIQLEENCQKESN